MKKIKTAAIIILIHGIIEIFGVLGVLMANITGVVDISEYMHFILPAFNSDVVLVSLAGGIYGILRVIASIGLFKNKNSGYWLAMVLSCITLSLMMFVLPAGIMDGLLAGAVLVILLGAKFKGSIVS